MTSQESAFLMLQHWSLVPLDPRQTSLIAISPYVNANDLGTTEARVNRNNAEISEVERMIRFRRLTAYFVR
jgi:hypothetical protein